MAKRYTDTDKWKKPFIRGLQGAYKLLWFYILDDCDHAGIWAVDFEVARIRIGEQVDRDQAIRLFGDRIEILPGGSKWFLRDFIDFQYGPLSEKNRMHLSVINLLNKNNIKPLGSPLEGAKDKVKEQDKDKDKDKEKERDSGIEDWKKWGQMIVDDNDPSWGGRTVTQSELDNFLSVAVRNDWRIDNAGHFRICLMGFIPDGDKKGPKMSIAEQRAAETKRKLEQA